MFRNISGLLLDADIKYVLSIPTYLNPVRSKKKLFRGQYYSGHGWGFILNGSGPLHILFLLKIICNATKQNS